MDIISGKRIFIESVDFLRSFRGKKYGTINTKFMASKMKQRIGYFTHQ